MLRTVREALTTARGDLALLVTDPRLTTAEQSLCADLVARIDTALSRLRADNTWPNAQRAALKTNLQQRIAEAVAVDEKYHFLANVLYDAVDLLWDVGDAAAAGAASFETVLSEGRG